MIAQASETPPTFLGSTSKMGLRTSTRARKCLRSGCCPNPQEGSVSLGVTRDPNPAARPNWVGRSCGEMGIPWSFSVFSSWQFGHSVAANLRAHVVMVVCYYGLVLLSTTQARANGAVGSRTNKGITSLFRSGCVHKGRSLIFEVCVVEPRF